MLPARVAPISIISDVTTVIFWALILPVAMLPARVAPFSIISDFTIIWALKLLVACFQARVAPITAFPGDWAIELLMPVFPAIITLFFAPHFITTIIFWALELFVAYFAASKAPFSVHSPRALVLFMAMLATLIAYGIHLYFKLTKILCD